MAHIFTNAAMISLQQYKVVPFSQAGAIKVKSLDFWGPPGTSDAMRQTQAQSLAAMIDGVINQWVDNVNYEKGYAASKTVKTIGKVLQDGEKCVSDVGDAVDECFFFAEEFHEG
jgi:hypothetical protein